MPTTKRSTDGKELSQVVFPNLKTLEQLLAIGQSLTTVRDLAALLTKIARAAGSILHADAVVLYEYQAGTDDVIVPPTVWGKFQQPRVLKVKGRARAHRDSLVFRVLKKSQPIYATDAAADWAKVLGLKAKRAGVAKGFIQREGIVSSAAVRLTVHKDTVGVIFVNYRTSHTFSDEEKRITELFATQAAAAIQNARLLQSERNAQQRAETLRKVAQIVNSTLSLDEVVDSILDQLDKVIPYNSASVQLIQGDRRLLIGGQGLKSQEFVYALHKNVSKDPLVSQIIQQRRPMVIGDVTLEPRWEILPETEHVKSWMGVPLMARDQVIGLLTLDHQETGYYTRESGELVAAFANQVAMAIYNSIQTQALTELTQLTQQFISIRESRRDAGDLLKQVARSALKVLKADVVDFYEYRQEVGQFVIPPITSGERRNPAAPKTEIREDDVIIQLARRNESRYMSDVQNDDVFATPFSPDRPADWPANRFAVREEIVSTAFVPLKAGSEIVGYMFVSYRTPQMFAVEQQRLIEMFASQAATAINNSRLMTDLQNQIERHEVLNEVGGNLMAGLEETAILDMVAQAAARTLTCTHCSVFRVNEEGDLVVAAFKGNRDWSFSIGRKFPRGKGIAGRVAQENQTALVQNALECQDFARGWSAPQPDPLSLVVVPIRIEGQVYGVISAEHDQVGSFDVHDQYLLEILASQASQALRIAKLFIQLGSLHSVIQERDLDKVFDRIGEAIVIILGKEASPTINLYDEAKQSFGECHAYGLLKEDLQIPPRSVGGTGGYVVTTKKPLYLEDVGEPPPGCPTVRPASIEQGIKSFAAIPLMPRENAVVGVLFVNLQKSVSFSSEIQRVLEIFARQAAIAIENARLFGQANRQVDELKALHEVGKEITASLHWMKTLQIIADKVRDLTQATRSLVVVIDESTGNVTARGCGYPAEHLDGFTLQELRDGVSGWVIENKKPVLIPDVSLDERCVGIAKDKAAQFETKALAIAPLWIRGRVIGTLTAVGTKESPAFSESALETVVRLADQAAIAIENANLFEREQRRANELELINRAAYAVSSTLDLETVLQAIMSQAILVLNTEAGSVLLLDEVSNDLVFAAAAGPNGEQLRGMHVPLDGSIAGQAARENRSLVVGDAQRDERLYHGVDKVSGLTTQHLLAVPLRAHGRTIGVIEVINKLNVEFSESDIALLEALAGPAAIAIENAHLYEELQERAAQLVQLQEVTANLLTESNDPDKVLKLIATRLSKIFGAYSCTVRLYDRQLDQFTSAIAAEDPVGQQTFSLPRLNGTSQQILQTRQPVYAEDVYAALLNGEPVIRSEHHDKGVEAVAYLPLLSGNEVVGRLAVLWNAPRHFSENDKRLLNLFAGQASATIKIAQLYDQLTQANGQLAEKNRALAQANVQLDERNQVLAQVNVQLDEKNEKLAQANQQLDRKIRDLKAVYEVSQQLTSAVQMSEQDVVALIHAQTEPLMDTDNMYIALYDEKMDEVSFPLMYVDGRPDPAASRRGGKGRTEWIIRNRQSIFNATRVDSEAWYQDPEHKEYIGQTFASWVGVPMIAGEKVLGVIATYHKTQDNAYTEDDREVLSLMASQAAIVLQNARMWEVMQKLSEDLSAGD
jgi:GAF domain-containing protein